MSKRPFSFFKMGLIFHVIGLIGIMTSMLMSSFSTFFCLNSNKHNFYIRTPFLMKWTPLECFWWAPSFEIHCWQPLRWSNFTILVNSCFASLTQTLTKHISSKQTPFDTLQIVSGMFHHALCIDVNFGRFWVGWIYEVFTTHLDHSSKIKELLDLQKVLNQTLSERNTFQLV